MTSVSLVNITASDTVFVPGGRSVLYIDTPQLMTIPLMTNQNYHQSSLQKMSAFLLKKVKVPPLQATKAIRVGRGIAVPF